MQFDPFLAQIHQRIWGADPKEGPIWIPKWNISDSFHQCNLRPTNVGKFAYMVPPVTYDTSRLLCIDLVILMDWVNSPELF